MAGIVRPTWAEVQQMDPIILQAISIVRGEQNGDEFFWDEIWEDDEGKDHRGIWKSYKEQRNKKHDGEIILPN